jgi:iron-sulfur cluster repair protein YtfE (RIC family)
MRRHEALHPFSRDHSVGLVLARRLMREDSTRELLRAWDLELKDHFLKEEALLGPLIQDPELRVRFMDDHLRFEELVEQIRREKSLRAFQIDAGRLLDEHIRWEEHVLFPHIEQVSSDAELRALRAQTDLLEDARANSPLEPRRGLIVSRRLARLRREA